MGGLVRLMATLAGMGVKAYKVGKGKSKRKKIGSVAKSTGDKVKKSASDFVKRRKKLGGPKSVKNKGPSTKEVMGFSGAVGATAAGGIYAKKKRGHNKK